MKHIDIKIVGTSPLLMSCDKLADPLSKEKIAHNQLTNNKKKTEEDHVAIAKSAWRSALYWDEKDGLFMPTINVRAALVSGAKMLKLGQDIKRGTAFLDEKAVFEYDKKLKTKDQLWDNGYIDRRSVVIARQRVMAYRPKFTVWSVTCQLTFDENILDPVDIQQSLDNAGRYCGIGGFRPEKGGAFGRFEIACFDVKG